MTLRDQLASKARRRVRITVQVSDPTDDERRAAEARTFLLAGQVGGTAAESVRALEDALTEATAAVWSHFVEVEFTSLAPLDFELLLNAHTDRRGDVDRDKMRAALAAACAVDEDLRDEAWWAEQFASGQWSRGELDEIYQRLLVELNYSVPTAAIPKD